MYSRYVVGWMVAHRESATLAERLISNRCERQGVESGQLTVHADHGSSKTSNPVALLLADLGVTAATLSHWRDRFLAGAEAGLKERDTDAREDENRRLKAKIGELMMTQELLQEQVERALANASFAVRKSWNR